MNVQFIIENNGEARYDPEVIRQLEAETERISKTGKKQSTVSSRGNDDSRYGPTFDYENICKAMEFVFQSGETSKSRIQRYLHIGFNKSADIVDQLEEFGFISPRNGSKPGEILIDYNDFCEWKLRNAP